MGNLLKLEKILLILITVFAFGLRIYKLDKVPPSLYWDETAMALDAKTISLTGRDQHGNSWLQPIFPSWGDYKLPGYIISAAPFFMVIKNNPELAIRLPSALAGTLTVLVIYFLTKEFFNNFTSEESSNATSEVLALTASLLLTISPWHLQFSRAAFEANLALFFNTLSLLFFLKSNKRKFFLLPGSILAILGIYTYYASRIVMPFIFIAALLLLFNKTVKSKTLIVYLLFGLSILLLALPLKFSYLSAKAEQFRLSTKNIFSNPVVISYSTNLFLADGNSFWAKKIHNRFIYKAKELLTHLFDHLSLNFLILSGDSNLRHSTTGIGVLLLAGFIGLIFGEFYLWQNSKKLFVFLNSSLLICFLPASATYEIPHSLRSLNAVVFINIISAYGLIQLFGLIKNKKSLLFAFCFLLFAQFIFYLHDYYVHYPQRSYFAWQGGYKEAVKKVSEEWNRADKIILTNYYWRPYLYFLLYTDYPLKDFQIKRQELLSKNPLNYEETREIGKIEFRQPQKEDTLLPNTLIIKENNDFFLEKGIELNSAFYIWKNY